MTEAKWSAVHGEIGEHVLVCNKVKVARFINASTLDGVVRKVNAHDALVAALGLSYEALSGMGEQTEAASAAAYDALEATKEIKTHSEASVINAWKYSYGQSKFGEGF